MKLCIGNKNYSSWSMRPWVLMRDFDIPFDEVMLRFDSFEAGSTFKQAVLRVSPAGRVPVLVLDDGHSVWDTLAIAETLADHFPTKALWPSDPTAKSRARSIACEMHSGFGALRNAFPMNIEASLPHIGMQQLEQQPAVAADLARIDTLWRDAVERSGGPFLFGAYSIADAMYAPVVSRLRTYALKVSLVSQSYADRVWASKGVSAWVREALAERTFVAIDEPYRQSR